MLKSNIAVKVVQAGVGLAALAMLAACSATPKIIDNPKDGDKIDLTVGQPFTVKLTDMDGPKTDWVLSGPSSTALTSQGRKVQEAKDGALPLEIYSFTGAAAGEQQLTFSYRHPDEPASPDNTMTVTVTVKG